MSMLQKIKLKLTDEQIVKRATKMCGWKCLGQGQHNVGYGNNVEGVGYEKDGTIIVIDETGDVSCLDDNMRQAELNKLKARYGAEKAKTDARKQGYNVTEKIIDGKIKIIATEG